MKLGRLFPLLGQLRGYDRADLGRDLAAGLTTAVMLVPQAMAYAMLAGLEPVHGLYAATVPVMVYALLGASPVLAVGPVALDSLLTAAAVAPLAGEDPGRWAALAAGLALLVGLALLAMGLLRLGALVKLLSRPVLAGFTSAAALVIAASQLGNLLGLSLPRASYLHQTLAQLAQHLEQTNPVTLALGLGTFATLLLLKRLAPRFPRFLLVVVLGTVLTWALGLDLAIVGEVPTGLPAPGLPGFGLADAGALGPAALTIALVAFMESTAVTRVYARRDGYRVPANRELFALGGASIASGLFAGYPVAGGFSRTAVNAQAGAVSGVAGLVTGAVVLLTLLFFTPLFHFLPKAVLAAIILSAVLGLVELREVGRLWRSDRADLGLMALTFAVTLLVGIDKGILVGVAANMALFVWKSAAPRVQSRRLGEAQVLRIKGPLFFANAASVKDAALEELDGEKGPEQLILDLEGVTTLDSSAAAMLGELIDEVRALGLRVQLSGLSEGVAQRLEASGALQGLEPGALLETTEQALGTKPPLWEAAG